jgi:hypothetical protein
LALARYLEHALRDTAALLLHDRQVPGTSSNIDHIVIAGGGVFVLDAKNYSGPVERRVDLVGRDKCRECLYVNGRNADRLIRSAHYQEQVLRSALADLSGEPVPVQAMLCFLTNRFPQLATPLVEGIRCVSPSIAAMAIRESGALGDTRIVEVTEHLEHALPPHSP